MSERLPAIKARDLVRVLEKAGFQLAHQKGSHATYKNPANQKRTTIPIHPGKDLKRGLVRGILNDLGWTQEEFLKRLRS